jgi:hypothetical protein
LRPWNFSPSPISSAPPRKGAQIDAVNKKETRDQKPFLEIVLADGQGKIMLRVWSDSPNYPICLELGSGSFVDGIITTRAAAAWSSTSRR